MRESTTREVEISDVSRATFLSLLGYVYTDRFIVADEGVKELFIAADRVCVLVTSMAVHEDF